MNLMDWGVKTAHLLLSRLQKMSAWYERHSKSMAPFFAYNEYSVLNVVIHQPQKTPSQS